MRRSSVRRLFPRRPRDFSKALRRARELVEPLGIQVPEGSTFLRVYAGHWERSCGAWSWFVKGPDGRELFGSHHPLSLLRPGSVKLTQDSRFDCEPLSVDPVR